MSVSYSFSFIFLTAYVNFVSYAIIILLLFLLWMNVEPFSGVQRLTESCDRGKYLKPAPGLVDRTLAPVLSRLQGFRSRLLSSSTCDDQHNSCFQWVTRLVQWVVPLQTNKRFCKKYPALSSGSTLCLTNICKCMHLLEICQLSICLPFSQRKQINERWNIPATNVKCCWSKYT